MMKLCWINKIIQVAGAAKLELEKELTDEATDWSAVNAYVQEIIDDAVNIQEKLRNDGVEIDG